jgi:hypothetical protein
MNQKVRIIQSEDEIPKGAVRVHLYDWHNVMMPRGSRKKESIYVYLLEHLLSSFEDWTEPIYGDNPDVIDLTNQMYNNMLNETTNAWEDFLNNEKVKPLLAKAVKERRKQKLCQKTSEKSSDTE